MDSSKRPDFAPLHNVPAVKQDHLRMNVAPDIKNHLWSIDLFRSMISKINRSKVVIVNGRAA